MKSLFRQHHKLTKREKVSLSLALLLLLLFSIGIFDIFGTSRKNKQLREANTQLEQKVTALQSDLERLSKEVGDSKNEITGQVNMAANNEAPKLSTLSVTVPETNLKIDLETTEGWELASENKLSKKDARVAFQADEIDLLALQNYKVGKVIDSYTLKSGKVAYLVFIPQGSANNQTSGYLSVSFCNPDLSTPCSYKDENGKFIFILAHAYQEGDQFVRDMDFNSPSGNMLLSDFKVMVQSLSL